MASSPASSPRFAYKGDRLKPLRAFCQTARLGSVSRAAEALYLSQPAVTLQLQALERELGVRLLERSGRRVTLTRASILSARTILITLIGSEKRELLEQAIADGHSSKLPIGRVLAEAEQPIDIHWCP